MLPKHCYNSQADHTPAVLMSSHRNYDNDKEWSWLRNHGLGLELLHFEPITDLEDKTVYELIVDEKWTTRVSKAPDWSASIANTGLP